MNSSFSGYSPSGAEYRNDMSYLGNNQLGDLFLRIKADEVYTPYIAHTDLDGYVMVHGHKLNGTKFFTWGQNGPGRYMQDFLAGGRRREGDYTELQVGPAPTQMQTFPVPSADAITGAPGIYEWTEWFKGFDGDVEKLTSLTYKDAVDEVDSFIQSKDGVTNELYDDIHKFLISTADIDAGPDAMISKGSSWGYLEEMLTNRKLAKGLTFPEPDASDGNYAEIAPWLELLQDGTFSASLNTIPLSYQTTDGWLDVLLASASAEGGMTWLHAMHLGVCYMERGEVDRPRELFKQSLALNETGAVLVYRNLAVLETDTQAVWGFLQQAWGAWSLRDDSSDVWSRLGRNLSDEICKFLIEHNMVFELGEFLDTLYQFQAVGHDFKSLDLVQLADIVVNLAKDEDNGYDHVIDVLSSACFPTFASTRTVLVDSWWAAVQGKARLAKGSDLTVVEAYKVRKANKIPDAVGCQYGGEYCDNYW
jgi:hypothetical protein